MSLLNLIYFDDHKMDYVITAVREWCGVKGYDFDSIEGRNALDTAVRLAKAQRGQGDLLTALFQELSDHSSRQPSRQVLIVEDEPLIAMDLEHILSQAGYATVLFLNYRATREWLIDHTPVAAVLDFKLKDDTSEDLATLLISRQVPLIFCSGADPADVPEIFLNATWLPKPCDYPKLLATMEDLMLQVDFARAMEQRT